MQHLTNRFMDIHTQRGSPRESLLNLIGGCIAEKIVEEVNNKNSAAKKSGGFKGGHKERRNGKDIP